MAGYDRRPFMTMTRMRMWMRMSKEIIKPKIIKMKYRNKRRERVSSVVLKGYKSWKRKVKIIIIIMDRGAWIGRSAEWKKERWNEEKRAKLLLSTKRAKVEEIMVTKSLLFTRVPKVNEEWRTKNKVWKI